MPPLSPQSKVKGRAIYKLFGLSVVVPQSPHSQFLLINYHVVTRAHYRYKTFFAKMGRGAYDTTYVCNKKDSAAAVAIAMHSAKAAEAAKMAAVEAAEAAEAKLIRSKKSRGIMAARKAAKEEAAAQMDTYESEGDSDTTERP